MRLYSITYQFGDNRLATETYSVVAATRESALKKGDKRADRDAGHYGVDSYTLTKLELEDEDVVQ